MWSQGTRPVRRVRGVALSALLASSSLSCAHREAPATRSFLAAAPQGMSLDDLGRPYDRDFQRVQGPGGASLFPKAPAPAGTLQARMDHQFVTAEDEETLRANASAWTLSAGVGLSSKRRYASYRAYQVDRVHSVDDTTRMRNAPSNAVYYPWRIYVGRRYEVLFEGDEDSFDASARAELGVASGSIENFRLRKRIDSRIVAVGLRPRSEQAIFAKGPAEVEREYVQHDTPVPILVEWRVIPGRVDQVTPIKWRQRKQGCVGEPGCEPCAQWEVTAVEYTAPGRKRGGSGWDADGSAPDLILELRVGMSDASRTSGKFQDRVRATWQIDPSMTLDVGAQARLRVTDSDWAANDHVDLLTVEVPAEIPNGRLEMSGGAAVLSARCKDASTHEPSGPRFIPSPPQ